MAWKEVIAPDEAARFEQYGQEIRALQAAHARGGAPQRTLHTKAHVGAVGWLTIREDVPAALRAGVLAAARTFPVLVRFSNGQPGRRGDHVHDVRGVALKLVGVEGPKLIPGLEDAPTQDFLFIQVAALGVRDPHEFMTLLRLAARGQALLVPRLVRAVGLRRAWGILRGFIKMPKVRSMAATRFFTAAPIAVGEGAAAKLALFPRDPGPPGGRGKLARDGLREDLVARLAAGPIVYGLHAQLHVDDETTPIEDASVVWPEDKSPWIEVGELTLPAQQLGSERGRATEALIESLSFDPWHALPAHRPLGAVMRARAVAYRESVIGRASAPEPSAVPEPG